MKKLALTIAIVLGLGLTTFADPNGGGVFGRGESTENPNERTNSTLFAPKLPEHTLFGNQNAPLGSGVAIMLGLGAAYLVSKKRKED